MVVERVPPSLPLVAICGPGARRLGGLVSPSEGGTGPFVGGEIDAGGAGYEYGSKF